MPFQSVYSTYSQHIGIITALSAGGNIQVGCATEITMYGTFEGDEEGHIFEWEQLVGDPVIWISQPGDLTAVFQFSTFDNKLMRLWMDKGRASERFDDAWAWASPVTECNVTSLDAPIANMVDVNEILFDARLALYLPTLPGENNDT